MTFPADPALDSVASANPGLWSGCEWLYLPNHSRTGDIISSDVISTSGSTSIATYAEGEGEVFNGGDYKQSTIEPLDGETQCTFVAYLNLDGFPTSTDWGLIGTAPTVSAFANCLQLVLRGSGASSNASRIGAFARIGGVSQSAYSAETFASNDTILVVGGRNPAGETFISTNGSAKSVSAGAHPAYGSNTDNIIVGSYFDHAGRSAQMGFFWGGFWNRELSTAEIAQLGADPYALFRKTAPELVLDTLKNNTGTVLGDESGISVWIYSESTGELIASLTDQASDASGVVTLSPPGLQDGSSYRVVLRLSSGAEGLTTVTAAMP